MSKIVIIDYGAGNIQSVQYALERLGVSAMLTNSFEEIKAADKVILPGVGHAEPALKLLQEAGLDKLIPTLKQPVLGICLGMQLMCNFLEENNKKGLGIFKVDVKKFSDTLKVPHIGWNQINQSNNLLFNGIEKEAYVYFVHSYFADLGGATIAETDYGHKFSSALQQNNFYGCQFHPEKSGTVGQTILNNFIKM